MGRKQGQAQAASIEQLRQKIEHWRKTRQRRTRMPQELWEAAVAVAREHGVHATARALRIGYEGLRARVGKTPERAGRQQARPKFVELGPGLAIGGASVVELQSASGTKLLIRLG